MFFSNINISFSRIRVNINKSLGQCHFVHYHGRVNVTAKRGSILETMIADKDKRKKWHFNIVPTKPKVRMFDKIHKPFRRRAVLNSVFIKNITDVISTGEIIPEIANYGIGITGVQISPCYKILNVFWHVCPTHFDSCEDIGNLLNAAALKIRAELISRNVIGCVPFIYFLRDCTNARVAEFEQAYQKLESEGTSDSCVIVDDSFTKDIYSFKNLKAKSVEVSLESVKKETKKDLKIAKNPLDMKNDLFGLDHEAIMEKIMTTKRKKCPPQNTAVISPESLANEDDIFSKIPGVCFKGRSSEAKLSREAIFKKFHVERKMLAEKNKSEDCDEIYVNYEEGGNEVECNFFDEDFVEDETERN